MKPVHLIPWYHTPWCVMCQLFLFPPVGLFNLLVSKGFSWSIKTLMLILSACFVLLLWGNKNFYQEHLNELWLSKYNQMKREFRYKKAGSYLYRRQFAKPAERLMELLLKIDYEYSVGSKHVIELRKEAELILANLFAETLAEYINLLNHTGLSKAQKYTTDHVLNFDNYYDLFKKEGNLSWGVGRSPLPSAQQVLEALSDHPTKLAKLKSLMENFEVILASLTYSRTQNLLTPLIMERQDIEKIKSLLTYASACRVILDYKGGLKFYFYAYAALVKANTSVDSQGKWSVSLSEMLDDFVDQSSFHLKAYMLRGIYRLSNGEMQKAREDFEHVFKLDVNFPQVWELLKILDIEPSCLEALSLYRKAENLRFEDANFEKSLALFNDLLHISWDSRDRFKDEILFNMGVMYRNNLKDYEKAIECFSHILKIPDSFRHEEARYNLIMCYYYRRDFEAMESLTSQFMKSHSNSDRIPRIIMINVGMKLIKVFRRVLSDLLPLKEMGSANE